MSWLMTVDAARKIHFHKLPLPVEATASHKFKVTQAFPSKQRICGPQDEDPPWSPGNRHSGVEGGIQGKRSSTEHAVSAANPRTGKKSRAGEACPHEQS